MTQFDDSYLAETIRVALGDELNYHVPRGIVRYDYASSHGWWVRMHRDEAPFQKMFWDSHHEGITGALKAAIDHRHEILASFPVEKKTQPRKFKEVSSNPEERVFLRGKEGSERWDCVWYDENHKLKKKQFSVNRLGEGRTKELALAHTIANHNKTPKPPTLMTLPDPYAKQKFKSVSRDDVEVLASINSGAYKGQEAIDKAVEDSMPMALEGGKKLTLHMQIERDRGIRDAKIRAFMEEQGAIFCEVCRIRFTEQYPFLEADLIEVHHIVPLHTLSNKTEVRLNDLILLCPNCHTVVHQGDEETNLLLAMDIFDEKRKNP